MDTAALVDRIPVSPLAQGAATSVAQVRGVDKNYKRTAALRDIHMDVGQGEVFGLIGPDGSGKSSLIRAIAGVQQYDAGIITVFGTRVDSERSAERVKSRIGLMPQGLGNNLYPQLPMVGIILLASVVTLFFIIEGALALNVRGSIGLFLGVTALFSASAAGLGILIASLTRNMGQVGIVSITLMPILFMLSGSDTPPEMMPDTLLPIMYLSPLHHYLNAAFGILIKGADLSMVWDSILYVAVLGGCVFAVSLFRFRQSFR